MIDNDKYKKKLYLNIYSKILKRNKSCDMILLYL